MTARGQFFGFFYAFFILRCSTSLPSPVKSCDISDLRHCFLDLRQAALSLPGHVSIWRTLPHPPSAFGHGFFRFECVFFDQALSRPTRLFGRQILACITRWRSVFGILFTCLRLFFCLIWRAISSMLACTDSLVRLPLKSSQRRVF